MKILNELGKKMLFFDGGLGTMLQAKGAQPGEMTELWNIKDLRMCWMCTANTLRQEQMS